MPRKKKTIVEETIPDDVQTGEDITDIICVYTKVYRLNAGSKSFCFQTSEPVDEVSIQSQYPQGGKFVVIEYNSLSQPLGNPTYIDIEPKPMPAGAAVNNGDDFRNRMLLDELNFTRNMMLKMIEGMSNKSAASATPFGELVEGMRLMHEMQPKNGPIDLIVKGMEIGSKANGGGATDWKAELISAAKEYAPVVVNALGPKQPVNGAQPMITTSPQAMMKQGLDWLKPQILSGMSVDLAIGWVIQNAKDPLCNQLIANAIKGDVNTFIAIDPELANEPYRTWFESAIQLLKDEYAQQQGAVQNDSERGTGNDTDVTVDAPASNRKSKVTKIS